MAKRTLQEWLADLPAQARELRVRAGGGEADMEACGSLDVEAGEWTEERVERVCLQVARLVEDADTEPKVVRVDAYAGVEARGKHLRSWQNTSTGKEAPAGARPGTRTGPMSAEERDWAIIDRLCASNERLIGSLAQPIEAMAGLFGMEAERRENAEAEARELADLNARLTALVPDPEALNVNDPLRLEVVDILKNLSHRLGVPGVDKGKKSE